MVWGDGHATRDTHPFTPATKTRRWGPRPFRKECGMDGAPGTRRMTCFFDRKSYILLAIAMTRRTIWEISTEN